MLLQEFPASAPPLYYHQQYIKFYYILQQPSYEEIGGLLADFLEAEGYDTYLALSGEEALEVYAEETAKLIILDIMLPGIDGFTSAAALPVGT